MDEERQTSLCTECGDQIRTVRSCKSKRAGLCSRCFRRAYDRAYRQSHRDRYRQYAHRYYEQHRERLKERNTQQKRNWREGHRAHYRAYQRDYKRRMRSGNEGYAAEELPVTCGACGADISEKWATKARRAGLCSPCYERRARSQHYRRSKLHQAPLSGMVQQVEEAAS